MSIRAFLPAKGIIMFSLLLNAYFFILRVSAGGSFPKPLSAAEERHYLSQASTGDQEARNILIERNLRLVAHIMKKYYSSVYDKDDLIAIGTIGLMKAVSTFKPDKNTRLATYAARCIENEILMHFRSIRRMQNEISLQEPIDTDGEGNTLALLDVLRSEDDMLEAVDLKEKTGLLRVYMRDKLDGLERDILIMRYGLGNINPLTQREIAVKCGISRSYVSRIEKRAVKKLEEAFGCGGFSDNAQ